MKRILAMLLALMLVSAMTVGFVAYADEPVAEETPVETVEEAAPATPSQEDFESMMQYMTYDFTKPDVVVISSYVTGSENLLNYFKDSSGESAKIEEINGAKALVLPESEVPMEQLSSGGVGYIEDKGFFVTKNIYTYVLGDMAGSGEDGTVVANLTFKVNGIVTYTNTDKVKGGASVDITVGKNNNVVVIANSVNWINLLIALMVLVVIILVVLIAVFSKKKKKLAAEETGVDALENPVEGLEDAVAEIKEEVAETTEEISEVIEEVKEEAEEVVEEITEAVEEKTEE